MLVTMLFYWFATVLVAAGLGVILSRNPVHSAMSLVLCFVTSAALWLLIEAEFLAIVLVLVYVGAVMVLFLFVVMMLNINTEQMRAGFTRHAWLGALVVVAAITELLGAIFVRQLGVDVQRAPAAVAGGYSNTQDLGVALFTRYAYPVELAAMLLLVAIVAAIALTMRKRRGLKLQDINAQVAVRAADRLRIIKMSAEKAP
jgi:NADH-quinone oxidoreductase subunit J